MASFEWCHDQRCQRERACLFCATQCIAGPFPIWAHWQCWCRKHWIFRLGFTQPPNSIAKTDGGISGIKVQSSWKYTASFYYRFPTSSPAFTATSFTLTLQTTSGQVLASTSVSGVSGNQTTWRQLTVELYPSANASNTNNVFTIQADAAKAGGATVNFAMLSLMPPTYKGRANGMRIDLAEVR